MFRAGVRRMRSASPTRLIPARALPALRAVVGSTSSTACLATSAAATSNAAFSMRRAAAVPTPTAATRARAPNDAGTRGVSRASVAPGSADDAQAITGRPSQGNILRAMRPLPFPRSGKSPHPAAGANGITGRGVRAERTPDSNAQRQEAKHSRKRSLTSSEDHLVERCSERGGLRHKSHMPARQLGHLPIETLSQLLGGHRAGIPTRHLPDRRHNGRS